MEDINIVVTEFDANGAVLSQEVIGAVVVNSAADLEALFASTVLNSETLPEGAEVLLESASTPRVAAGFGVRKAAEWTKRGYAYECVGVLPYTSVVLFEGVPVERAGFRAVCVPVS